MSREQQVVPLLFPVGLEAADVLLFKRLFVTMRAQSLQVDQPALHFFKLPLQKGWEHTHAHTFTYKFIHTGKVLYIMVTRTNRKRKNKKKQHTYVGCDCIKFIEKGRQHLQLLLQLRQCCSSSLPLGRKHDYVPVYHLPTTHRDNNKSCCLFWPTQSNHW